MLYNTFLKHFQCHTWFCRQNTAWNKKNIIFALISYCCHLLAILRKLSSPLLRSENRLLNFVRIPSFLPSFLRSAPFIAANEIALLFHQISLSAPLLSAPLRKIEHFFTLSLSLFPSFLPSFLPSSSPLRSVFPPNEIVYLFHQISLPPYLSLSVPLRFSY